MGREGFVFGWKPWSGPNGRRGGFLGLPGFGSNQTLASVMPMEIAFETDCIGCLRDLASGLPGGAIAAGVSVFSATIAEWVWTVIGGVRWIVAVSANVLSRVCTFERGPAVIFIGVVLHGKDVCAFGT